jgi:hypothetical protein
VSHACAKPRLRRVVSHACAKLDKALITHLRIVTPENEALAMHVFRDLVPTAPVENYLASALYDAIRTHLAAVLWYVQSVFRRHLRTQPQNI